MDDFTYNFVELFILIFNNYSFFNEYQASIPYMIWFIPASILSIFVQISYIFLISKNIYSYLIRVFYASSIYLISALFLSIIDNDCIWFAILFNSPSYYYSYPID